MLRGADLSMLIFTCEDKKKFSHHIDNKRMYGENVQLQYITLNMEKYIWNNTELLSTEKLHLLSMNCKSKMMNVGLLL